MASTRDFQKVYLADDDVPGAKIDTNQLESYSNVQLKRWLECRGVKSSGNRPELLQRWVTPKTTPTFFVIGPNSLPEPMTANH